MTSQFKPTPYKPFRQLTCQHFSHISDTMQLEDTLMRVQGNTCSKQCRESPDPRPRSVSYVKGILAKNRPAVSTAQVPASPPTATSVTVTWALDNQPAWTVSRSTPMSDGLRMNSKPAETYGRKRRHSGPPKTVFKMRDCSKPRKTPPRPVVLDRPESNLDSGQTTEVILAEDQN